MIKNRITLKQLEALVCVADVGTFRQAAGILGTTQPNISVRIATMEDTLGTVLMHRDAGSVQLTEKGREVLAAARQVLNASEVLLEVAERRDLVDERLRLGVTELVASTWLHAYLRALKTLYPAIRVELTVDYSREIEKQLAAGQLELAILTEPFKVPPTGLVPLGRCPYGWIAAPAIAEGLGPQPDLSALHATGILTHSKHTMSSIALRNHLEDLGLPSDYVAHSSSLTSCLNMAVDGMGIALLPDELFKAQIAQGYLVEVMCPWKPDPLTFFARFDEDRAPRFVVKAAALSKEIASTVG